MRILGIDCGSQATGYGVVDSDGRRHRLVASGVIRTSAAQPFSVRLQTIHRALTEVIREAQPAAVAVEEVFHGKSAKSALKLAHVRGVALLGAAEHGLVVGEYSPLEIKRSVVGYGRAEKRQVQQMVASLLGLRTAVRPHDAADALAVAICHATATAADALLSEGARKHAAIR